MSHCEAKNRLSARLKDLEGDTFVAREYNYFTGPPFKDKKEEEKGDKKKVVKKRVATITRESRSLLQLPADQQDEDSTVRSSNWDRVPVDDESTYNGCALTTGVVMRRKKMKKLRKAAADTRLETPTELSIEANQERRRIPFETTVREASLSSLSTEEDEVSWHPPLGWADLRDRGVMFMKTIHRNKRRVVLGHRGGLRHKGPS